MLNLLPAATSPGRRVLRTATALTTPLLPDDFLTLVNPLWSARELRGRVLEVRAETADAATLVVRPGWGWPGHEAGQWVRVGVRIDGVWHSRSYSITTPAGRAGAAFEVTVKAVDAGRVSRHLVHEVRPGAVVRLGAPQGDFRLPATPARPMLFLTAGAGITPVMGMLRSLVARGSSVDAVHVHSARTPHEVIFGSELRDVGARLSSYRLREQHTASAGRFRLEELNEVCPDWRERETWACGPMQLLDDIEEHWHRHGVAQLLHIERFQSKSFAPPDAAGGVVTFTRTGRSVRAAAETPLLEVGEAAGISMSSGCRMGICFSCVTPLRSGQVRDLRTGEVHGDEGDLVQTCVSAAAGACELEI